MQNLNKSINDANKSTTKLRDNLDKVDTKVQDITVSAKDIVKVLDSKFLNIIQNVRLEISKLSATITELHSHVSKAIEDNVKAGEKLATKMEKLSEKSLSVLKVKAIETQTLLKTTTSSTAENLKQHEQLIISNASLLSEKLEEINTKHAESGKKIGLLNLKGHKENVEAHIGELNRYKNELESATVRTGMQYDIMAAQYDKDSAEFKKAQDDKKTELEALKAKVEAVNVQIKKSNTSYLEIWNRQNDSAMERFTKQSKSISDTIQKLTKRTDNDSDSSFNKFSNDISTAFSQLEDVYRKQNDLDEKHKNYIDSRNGRKKADLDKEIKKLEADAKEKRKELEVDKLSSEKQVADENVTRYSGKIQELEAEYGLKKQEGGTPNSNEGKENKYGEAEIAAAQDRITALTTLKEDEEKLATEKAEKIRIANDIIFQSEEQVLKQKQEIEAEKAALDRKALEQKNELEAKKAKREEQLAKIKRIKEKAQHVVKIAQATGDIAKGVASAWAYGPFLGPALAALVALQGAFQLKIMTEQLKYMEDGGLLNGKRHSQGGMRIQGTNIEVEGGEYVVNRESTNKNLGLINYINSQRKELGANDLHSYFGQPFSVPTFTPPFSNQMEKGGQVPSFEPNVDILNSELLAGIQQIKIEPRVSVTDINTVHDNMVKVDEWTGI